MTKVIYGLKLSILTISLLTKILSNVHQKNFGLCDKN